MVIKHEDLHLLDGKLKFTDAEGNAGEVQFDVSKPMCVTFSMLMKSLGSEH